MGKTKDFSSTFRRGHYRRYNKLHVNKDDRLPKTELISKYFCNVRALLEPRVQLLFDSCAVNIQVYWWELSEVQFLMSDEFSNEICKSNVFQFLFEENEMTKCLSIVIQRKMKFWLW